MACDLTTGRSVACKDVMGGIKKVYFTTDALGAITYDITDTDVITTFGGTPEFMQYDLTGNTNTFVQTPTVSRDNGTLYFDQVLTVTFAKLSKVAHKELKLLIQSYPTAVVEDYNGNLFVMGLENQCSVNGGSIVTGGARADLSGYTLTLQAEEKVPANFLDTSDLTDTTATIAAAIEAP